MKARFSFALAALLWSSAALGLPLSPELPEDVRFDRLSLEHGLSQSTVYCVRQTRDGFLWLGTENGLNRFDGHGFRVFRFDLATDSAVQALEQDRAGALWVGTYLGGLIRFDPVRETWTLFRHEPGDPGSLADDGVRAILEDRSGRIWIGTEGGLDRYDPASGRFVHHRLGDDRVQTREQTRVQTRVQALLEDRSGRIWVGTLGGLGVLDPASGRFRHYRHDPADPASLSVDAAVALLESRSGSIWVGTRLGGLNRLDPATGRFERIQPASDVTVRTLHEDARGRIWIGTRAGLDVLDPESGEIRSFHADPEDPRRLSDDNIRVFHEDRTGLLWIGTTSGGLNRYDPWQHRFESIRAALSDPFVWTVHEDAASGGVWIGTGGAGLDLLDPATGRVRNLRHDERDPSSLSDDHVMSVLRDRRGTLWAGTAEGVLNRMEPGSRGFAREGEDLDGAITLLHEDGRGALWLGTWGEGLLRRDPDGRWTRYRHDPKDAGSLPGDFLRGLHEDRSGTIWLAAYDGGIAALGPDRRRFRRYPGDPADPRSLSDHRALALRAARGGGIWVGTQTGQLARLDPRTGRYTRFAWQDELSEVSVYDILEDGRGRLWLSSNRGLWRFDPRAGPAVRYGVRDGLRSDEFNTGAALRSRRTGEMYFGGVQGLSRFHPDRVLDRSAPPPVALTGFRKLNREVPLAGASPPEVRLTHRDNLISFELAALDFREPERNRYAYRLEGQDEGWIQAGTRRFASYTNLRGGDYILRVRGANGEGVWSPEAAMLRLHVTPPYWQTWWFRGLAALAVLAACAGSPVLWYRGRLRRAAALRALEIETKRRLFEARERERLRLARELHDGPVQDLHGLRLRLSARGGALESEVADMRRVSGELRSLCSELRPPHGDLATALRAHALRLGELHPEPRIDLELMRGGEGLPEDVWITLFRIAQEALANAVQHAKAQRIQVRLDVDAESARLEVEDDGRGFALPGRWIDLARQGHFGLLGMSERAEAVGAAFAAESAPGRGTVIRVIAPIDPSGDRP